MEGLEQIKLPKSCAKAMVFPAFWMDMNRRGQVCLWQGRDTRWWEFKHEFQLQAGLGRASPEQSHAERIPSFRAYSLEEDIIKAVWREGHLIYSSLKHHVLHIVIMMLILSRIHTKGVAVTASLCPMPVPSMGVSFVESASGDSRWRWVILGWN